jgi:hypothetical protein
MNEKAKFKDGLKRYLNTHSFYSVQNLYLGLVSCIGSRHWLWSIAHFSHTSLQFRSADTPVRSRINVSDIILVGEINITTHLRTYFLLRKIWGFHGSDYEECRLLGFKNPVRTSQETHYVSATEPSQLMLCKIWGFRGGDYEDCRLLGYETPVRTSQETHYISATEPSQLMLCKIWGLHGSNYEECLLLGYKNLVRTSQETH